MLHLPLKLLQSGFYTAVELETICRACARMDLDLGFLNLGDGPSAGAGAGDERSDRVNVAVLLHYWCKGQTRHLVY